MMYAELNFKNSLCGESVHGQNYERIIDISSSFACLPQSSIYKIRRQSRIDSNRIPRQIYTEAACRLRPAMSASWTTCL